MSLQLSIPVILAAQSSLLLLGEPYCPNLVHLKDYADMTAEGRHDVSLHFLLNNEHNKTIPISKTNERYA